MLRWNTASNSTFHLVSGACTVAVAVTPRKVVRHGKAEGKEGIEVLAGNRDGHAPVIFNPRQGCH